MMFSCRRMDGISDADQAEIKRLQQEYKTKFGEDFIAFDVMDFPATDTQMPWERYLEALEKAVKKDAPTRLKSHWEDLTEWEKQHNS